MRDASLRVGMIILTIAAVSAGHLGYVDESLGNWKQLFRISEPTDTMAVEAADTVLSLLQTGGDMEAAIRWVHEVRAAIPNYGRGFAVLWRDRLLAGDRDALRDLAGEQPKLEEGDALELKRLALDFNQSSFGRQRQLIDQLNGY